MKRKYTVTDKVRVANRLNLEKARAVPKEVLYRSTEKRRNACRANLLIGRQSPNYKPPVRHGLRAVNLRESAPQVGETEQEYDRHMELVESVLPARHERERNGVQGLGQALWRRRRLFGSRVHRETLGFYLELDKAVLDGLCRASLQDLSFSTWHLFADAEHPRLEWTTDRLDKRLVRVAEAYLTEYAERLVNLGAWGKHCYSPDFLELPPEVIGNALLSASVVKRRMGKGENKDMKEADLFDWDLKPSDMESGLLKEWVRLGYQLPNPRREEDFALHLRLIEAAFFGDRHAGFGLATDRVSGLSAGGPKSEVADGGSQTPDSGLNGTRPYEFPVSSLDSRVAHFKAAYPDLYQAVRTLAQTTWQRLQVFARQAEKEANDLREKLERAAAGTLRPGQKSLKELWQEARDRRLAEVPADPIDEALWAAFKVALEKAMAVKQKSEEGTGDRLQGTGAPNPEIRVPNPDSSCDGRAQQSAIGNHQSAILSTVECLIGVFLCSEAFRTSKPIEECNRRVEEAFQALEAALEDVLPPLERVGSKRAAAGSSHSNERAVRTPR